MQGFAELTSSLTDFIQKGAPDLVIVWSVAQLHGRDGVVVSGGSARDGSPTQMVVII